MRGGWREYRPARYRQPRNVEFTLRSSVFVRGRSVFYPWLISADRTGVVAQRYPARGN